MRTSTWAATCRDGLAERLARAFEPTARQAPQAQRVERAPVDGRGDRRADSGHRLGRAPRVQVAAPERGAPAAHRQERHVDPPGQLPHRREEAGVAGEVDAGGPGDQDAQGTLRGREDRAAASVFRVDCFERQRTDIAGDRRRAPRGRPRAPTRATIRPRPAGTMSAGWPGSTRRDARSRWSR